MMRCAVLGSPIAHSLSPRLHRAAYEFLGVVGTYEALEMPEADFPRFFAHAHHEGWTGFSLTMPLKERVNTEGIDIDLTARRINSVNTLFRRNDNWLGTSTDFLAFRRIFATISYSSVCVLGGGATARAAIAALDGTVETIAVALRNPAKFELLRESALTSKLALRPFNPDLNNFDLVVSTVPAGASDVLSTALAKTQGTFFDVLYNPWPTQIAGEWHRLGGHVINGLDLLVKQALDQISLMSEREFDLTVMRKVLNQAIEVERGRTAF